jgi:hypothetical protein
VAADPTRINAIRRAVVALLESKWNPTAPSEVLESFTYDVRTESFTGRKVLVFPDGYAARPLDRSEDENDYGFQIWIAEKYTAQAAAIPDDWVAERIAFAVQVSQWFDARVVPLMPTCPDARPVEAEVTTVYDVVDLIEHRLFVAVVRVVILEEAEG